MPKSRKYNKARYEEMAIYTEKNGRDAACVKYGLSRETLKRQLRILKQDQRQAKMSQVDSGKETLLSRIAEKYSEGELKALLDESIRPKTRSTQYDFSGDRILMAVASDWHIGSQFTNEDRIGAMADLYKREGASLLLIPGDLTEGMSGRDGHVYELKHVGYKAQKEAAIKALSMFTSTMDVKAISGNHDLWYASKGNMGALIVEDVCKTVERCEYLGEHEGILYLNGAKCCLWHGEDGSSYALSYRMQKIVESIEGGEKPQIIFAGHDHKAEYIPNLRNIQAVEAGCVQNQTPWMRRKKLAAYCGTWLVEATIKDGEVKRFRPEWIPFYK